MPADPSVSDTLAWIEYRKGLYSSAAQQLRDLVRQSPSNAVYQYHLGMALLKTGDPAEAKASLERALGANLAANYAENARSALAELGRKSL
jgi:predicted Zn-dependent protease